MFADERTGPGRRAVMTPKRPPPHRQCHRRSSWWPTVRGGSHDRGDLAPRQRLSVTFCGWRRSGAEIGPLRGWPIRMGKEHSCPVLGCRVHDVTHIGPATIRVAAPVELITAAAPNAVK